MKIGIIGSGDVGKALIIGFLDMGHQVMVGTRSPDKLAEWHVQNAKQAQIGSFKEACEFGQLVVLAVGWQHINSVIELAGKEKIDKKVVIDVTNPLDFSEGFPPKLAVAGNDSGGETIQRLLPDARVVKAWNIVGNASMYQPKFEQGTPTMWICGNDSDAKEQVTYVLNEFGWKDVIDIGDITGSRLLEPLCILWVVSGKKLDNYHIAVSLLQK